MMACYGKGCPKFQQYFGVIHLPPTCGISNQRVEPGKSDCYAEQERERLRREMDIIEETLGDIEREKVRIWMEGVESRIG